jgi:hypothetical protein
MDTCSGTSCSEIIPERRVFPRHTVPFVTIVRGCDANGQRFQVTTTSRNFSESGLFVSLDRTLRPGAKVFVSIRLALSKVDAAAPHIAARGTVLRMAEDTFGRPAIAVVFNHARFLYPAQYVDDHWRGEAVSVITFDPPLPCVHPGQNNAGTKTYEPCGHMAVIGVVTPGTGDAWELLPTCRVHAQEFRLGSRSLNVSQQNSPELSSRGL